MMKKKVLFVFPTAVLGGAERVMFNVIKMLLKDGHYVTVYIMSRGEQKGWDSIKNHTNLNFVIKKYKSEKTSLPDSLFSLFYLSHINKYDYTFSSHTHINGVLSFMRKTKLFKTNYLISRESTFVFERYFGLSRLMFKSIYKLMYGDQNLIVCQTEQMRQSLIQNLGYQPARKIEVVANPINLDYIAEQIANSEVHTKPFTNLIVACGRLIPLKKFDFLIEAFAKIHTSFPELGLVIVGDGSEYESLNNLVQRLGLVENILFTGRIDNPIQWFSKADIGIISSEIEGFPNVLIEMMAAGIKQVITTPCTDGVNNIPHILITEACSVESIANSLNSYLSNPIDNSEVNKDYIKNNRSAESFWQKIKEHIE